MSIYGAWEAWPPGQKLPRFFRKIAIEYHEPIPLEVPANKTALKTRVPEVNTQVRQVLQNSLNAWRESRK